MKGTAHQHQKVVQLYDPIDTALGAQAATGSVDCQGFDEALILFSIGDCTGSTVDFDVQDSADDSTFAAITGAVVTDRDSTTDNDVYVGRIDLRKRDRYLRVRYDVDTANAEFGVLVILSNPHELPVTQVNTAIFNV